MLGALRGVPAEQLLDLAITRLRAALPAGGLAERGTAEVPHRAGAGEAPVMTAEIAHEANSPIPPAANDNARSCRTGVALTGALQWRHPDAVLELAAALGEIAADLWLAGMDR